MLAAKHLSKAGEITIKKGQQYAIGDVAGGKGTQIFIEKSQQGGIERNLSKVTKLE